MSFSHGWTRMDHRLRVFQEDRGDDQYRFDGPEWMTCLCIYPCSIRVNPWLKLF